MAMAYQRWASPLTTTTLSVIMIDGFIISVMLKDRLFWLMHSLVILVLIVVFAFPLDDAITAGVTYLTLYFVLAFATDKLKIAYDQVQKDLIRSNKELEDKSKELSEQYKDLEDASQNLSSLNKSLEDRVNKRTEKIQLQNQVLLKYTYRNAHHLRGPVARLLGLASVYKLDKSNNPDEFIEKMVDQASEIDMVVKQINVDLAENEADFDQEL
jgi:signal transduction histidine kinase